MLYESSISLSAELFFNLLFRNTAYLDPGSGSYFIQLLIASLMGALFVLGAYRKKISQFIKNLFSRQKPNDDQEH